MTDVTRILSAIGPGDLHAAEQLQPLFCDELRRLAAQRMARERPGQALEATTLVHEAYLRQVGVEALDFFRVDGRPAMVTADSVAAAAEDALELCFHQVDHGKAGLYGEPFKEVIPDSGRDWIETVGVC
jgi:hypothetical protein